MARTTPAQKPRGWASITFIETSRPTAGSDGVLYRVCGHGSQYWVAILGRNDASRPFLSRFGTSQLLGREGATIKPASVPRGSVRRADRPMNDPQNRLHRAEMRLVVQPGAVKA